MGYVQWILYQPMRILIWLYRSIRGYIFNVQSGRWTDSVVGSIVPIYAYMIFSGLLVLRYGVPLWIVVIIGTLISSYYMYTREKKNG